MCSWDLPDMSVLALGRCALSGSCLHIRLIPPAHVTYITCNTGKKLLYIRISKVYHYATNSMYVSLAKTFKTDQLMVLLRLGYLKSVSTNCCQTIISSSLISSIYYILCSTEKVFLTVIKILYNLFLTWGANFRFFARQNNLVKINTHWTNMLVYTEESCYNVIVFQLCKSAYWYILDRLSIDNWPYIFTDVVSLSLHRGDKTMLKWYYS